MSDPLVVVESYLGSIERWPSSVIMDVCWSLKEM